MKLRHLLIENFRGLKTLELDLADTTVLIGENNVGKTAVLEALKFALREVRSRKVCVFDEYDFHLIGVASDPSTALPIRIRLTFREDNEGEWREELLGRLSRAKIVQVGTDGCATVILEVTAQFDLNEKDFVQDWSFLNLDGQPLINVSEFALGTLQNEVSFFYLPALRDAVRHFDARGMFWRPFLKESQLTPEQKTEIENMLAEVNNLIVTSHQSFSEVTTRLKDVRRVVPLSNGTDIATIDAVPGRVFDMLAKAQVNLYAETGAKVPVGRHGAGTQSLAVLMLFNAFLQMWSQGVPIVALEEPEAHLHPSAIRALWRLIEEIPGQKIISTHGGDLLAEVPPTAITRLHRENGHIKSLSLADAGLDEKQWGQFNFHIRSARGELLFARCWILAEGQTEVTLIPEMARIIGKDLECAGVRCVAYRQSDIGLYIEAAETLGIQWVAVCDSDTQGAKDQQKVRDALNGRAEADILHTMPEPDIEQHLCAMGFGSIYESLLSAQTQANVTKAKGTPAYWCQVTKGVSRYKIAAIPKILEMIRSGALPVPPLYKRAINVAIKLAEGA